MPDYTRSIEVRAPARDVFTFVSDVNNLPRYLPTVNHAHRQHGGRVEVEGMANGRIYQSDGWFKVDEQGKSLSWGSDGEHAYSGRLRVLDEGGRTRVECDLHFDPGPELTRTMEKQQGGRDAAVEDGLDAALQSIKLICEGAGGKRRSSADR